MSTEPLKNQIETLAEILEAGHFRIQNIGSEPFVALPAYMNIHNLEPYLEAPVAIKRAFSFYDFDSFISYILEFKENRTRAFAYPDGGITVCFDAHTKDKPSRERHKATLSPSLSREWKAWQSFSLNWHTHEQLAEFLEDNYEDIKKPQGADVLELAKKLHIKKTINVVSGVTLQSGDKEIGYTEESDGTQRKMTIPDVLELVIPVFKGDANYKVEAKLRYRSGEKGIAFRTIIKRSDEIIEDAQDNLIQRFNEKSRLTAIKLA